MNISEFSFGSTTDEPDDYGTMESPNSTETPSDEEFDPLYDFTTLMMTKYFPIIYAIITVTGFVGNGLVMLVILVNKNMRSTSNILILNLAATDLLFVIICVPFTAVYFAYESWIFGDLFCRLYSYAHDVCVNVSAYTLVVMSIERYLAIVHPFTSVSLRSEKNAITCVLCLWLLGLTSCIHSVFIHGETKMSDTDENGESIEYFTCTFIEGINHFINSIWDFCFAFGIPTFVMLVLYSLVLHKLWFGISRSAQVNAKNLKHVTRTVVTVVLVFFICWCPTRIIGVLHVRLLPAYL